MLDEQGHNADGYVDLNDIDQRIRELQEEQIRRLKSEYLRYYEPAGGYTESSGYKKLLKLHQSTAPIRGLVGMNKCGKSWWGTAEILWTVGKVHPYRPNYTGTVWARDCCVDFPTLRETLLPIYSQFAPRLPCQLDGKTYEGKPRLWPGLRGGEWKTAYNKEEKVLHFGDGSKVEFKSYDQDVDSFAGSIRHIIRHDEEPPQIIFGENLARQLTIQSNIIFTMTPLKFQQWSWVLLVQNAASDNDVETVQLGLKDNPFANQKVIELIEKMVTDEAEREARLYGNWTYQRGRIYKEYGEHNKIEYRPLPAHWPRVVAIDPHPEKPTYVTWAAHDRHLEAPIFYREKMYSGDTEEICRNIIRDTEGDNISIRVIDESAQQSATIRGQGSLTEEFERYLPGLELCSNHSMDATRDLVMRLVKQRPSGTSRFYVMDSCPMLHIQMLNYSWKPPLRSGEDRTKPTVLKKDVDFVDCANMTVQVLGLEDDFMDQYQQLKTPVYGMPGDIQPSNFGFTHIGRAHYG